MLNGFIHVSGKVIYFSEGGGLRACGSEPCDAANAGAPIYGLSTLGPIASDTTDVFVVERDPPRRIARCGLAGGCGQTPVWVAPVPLAARHLAVTATRILIGMENGSIYSVLRTSQFNGDASVDAGGQPIATATVLGGIAAEGTTLYFVDSDDGKLDAAPLPRATRPR